MIDIQRLSELYAATTQGAWHQCGANNGKCPCGLVWTGEADTVVASCHCGGIEPTPPVEQEIANANWVAEAHNAWPAVAARLAMLEEFARRVRSGIELADAATRDSWTTAAVNWIDSQTKKAGE